jgi:predicted HTH transcriptional regulator
MEYIIECKDKNQIRYIEPVSSKSFKEKLLSMLECNPSMTYSELANMSEFSEYDIRRTLGLIQ